MSGTFATHTARPKAQTETETSEATQSPEVVTATPRYLRSGFSAASDQPVSPLLRSQTTLQTRLTINQPGDAYEQEANRVAQQVVGSPTSAPQSGPPRIMRKTTEEEKEEEEQARNGSPQVMRKTTEEEKEEEEQARTGHVQTQRASNSRAPSEAPSTVHRTINRAGQPLEPATRAFMESRFGQDFGGVQVHTDGQAAQSAAEIGAEAYTVGQHIAFGEGRYAPGTTPGDRLIAHELTHVVQQTGDPTGLPASGSAVGVQQFSSDELVQLSWITDTLWSIAPDWVESLVDDIEAAGGIFNYIENLVNSVVDHVFGGLQQGANTVVELVEAFTTLYTTLPVISVAIISGNREMFTEAVINLANALQTIVGHAWDALDTLLGPVRLFLNGVIETLNQPIESWIESVAGGIWEAIMDVGGQLTDAVDWIFENVPLAEEAWNEVRDLIGIEFSGRDFTGWVRELAGEAWEHIKDGLSSVITSIQETSEVMLEVISVENIKTLRELVDGWIITVTDMLIALNSDDGNGIATAQDILRDVLMPLIQAGAAMLRGLLINAGTWVAGLIIRLAEKVVGFINVLASHSLIGAVVPELFAWVIDAVTSLATWAQSIVIGLFSAAGDGITYLAQFIEPVLRTVINLAATTTDLIGALPNLLTAAWEAIPAWIRDPIKDFVINQILARIPIFGELFTNPEVWARVQATAMQILQQIFVTGDLVGAAWTFFQALLELLKFPTDLVVQIVNKAAAVFMQIFEDPIGFLLNLLKAVKQGFVQFFSNILNHLLQGITDWLFGQAAEAGIQPPTDLSLGSILQFVMDILGLTMDLIWERLALKIGEERVAQIRAAIDVLTGAWEWISIAITEGPGALWEQMQSQISQLWDTIINAATQWITMKIIESVTVKLLSLLDPTGIMAVVNSLIALYKAIESFIQYIRQMLEIVNTVLDGIGAIAAGVVTGAAKYLEDALADALPIAIGFLANQVGLGNIGKKLAEIIQTVRGYVVKGVDWLIDKALQLGKGLLNSLGFGEKDKSKEDDKKPPEGTTEVKKPFKMNGEDHTLTIRIAANGKVSILMASKVPSGLAPAVEGAITQVTGMGKAAPKGLLNDLNEFLRIINNIDAELEQNFLASGAKATIMRPGEKTLDRATYAEREISALLIHLNNLAQQYGLTDLKNYFGSIPDKRYLPTGYDVRYSLYERDSDYKNIRVGLLNSDLPNIKSRAAAAKANNDQATFQQMLDKDEIFVPAGSTLAQFNPNNIPNNASQNPSPKQDGAKSGGMISYVVDHEPSIAEHWTRLAGNDTHDQGRLDQVEGTSSTLTVVTNQGNLKKGSLIAGSASERAYFTKKFWVGPQFRSEHADNNTQKARRIDGQPFLHSKDGPPIK